MINVKRHIRKRSKNSWSIVIDIGQCPQTRKRRHQWHTVKGTKKDAERIVGNNVRKNMLILSLFRGGV